MFDKPSRIKGMVEHPKVKEVTKNWTPEMVEQLEQELRSLPFDGRTINLGSITEYLLEYIPTKHYSGTGNSPFCSGAFVIN